MILQPPPGPQQPSEPSGIMCAFIITKAGPAVGPRGRALIIWTNDFFARGKSCQEHR